MMIKRILIFIVSSQMAYFSQAAYIANRDFLSVGHGARANAMGEAYAAVADDSSAIYWNSAGLTQLTADEMSFSYSDRFDGLATEAQAHYVRRGRQAMWGFAYAGSFVNDISINPSLTQADINAINAGTYLALDRPTDSVIDNALLFSYARPVQDGSPHSVGTTVKVIHRDLLGMVKGYGTAVDLGYHYITVSGTTRLGVNVQNAASIVSFSGDVDSIGTKATATESYIPTLKTGLAYSPTWRVLHGNLLVAFDANMLTSFDVEDYRAGIEYSFGKVISLRAGKIFERQDDSSEDFSLGMGISLGHYILDFSFLTNELGDTTRGTLKYRLGGDYYTPSKY